MAVTNRGKYLIVESFFRNPTEFTNLYMALVTNATPPTVDHNTLGELTEIANGNGYATGGYSLNRDATDFDTLSEDDSGDKAAIKIKDITWTAAGGSLPASGSAAQKSVTKP